MPPTKRWEFMGRVIPSERVTLAKALVPSEKGDTVRKGGIGHHNESSRRRACFFDRIACLRAFIDDFKRPSGVFGPVDLRLFRLLASILA